MSDEPFGRQPQPVYVTFEGEPEDVQHYSEWMKTAIEKCSYDNVERGDYDARRIRLTIYPAAVND